MERDSEDREPAHESSTNERSIRIGVSSCLLGELVRFDGGHQHDRYITDTLGAYFEWIPVCPEMDIGLGAPRESIRLVRAADDEKRVRLLASKSGADHTESMLRYADERVAKLRELDLCGYILKKDSPTCGMARVRVREPNGMATRKGRGLYAGVLLDAMPNLPVEEDGRLCDPRLRENWIERVFAYERMKALWKTRWRLRDLVAFHTAHKLTLLAHSPEGYATLGRVVAGAKSISRADLQSRYETDFMAAMAKLASIGRNVNVLQHMAGYFKRELDDASRAELQDHIEEYQRGLTPLVVPLTLIRHHVRCLNVEYLASQVYLNPHPRELMLRNHV